MSKFIDGKFQIQDSIISLPLGNRLGIGSVAPSNELDVKGTIHISKEYDNGSLPTTPSSNGGGILYIKSTDGRLYYKSNSVVEKDLTANASGSGEINTITNLGSGASQTVNIYNSKVGSDFKLKSLKQGTNILLTTDHNHITISSTASGGGGSGTVTGGLNLGTGEGIYIDIIGEDLRFKSISGITSTGISTVTSSDSKAIDISYTRGHLIEKGDSNIVVVDTDGASGGYIRFCLDGNEKLRILNDGKLGIGITNPDESIETTGRIHLGETAEPSTVASGDGGKLYVKDDGKLYFKSNHALTPKSIVDSVSNVTNLGTSDNNLYRSKSGENLEFRSLKAGNNILISTENNEIVLTSAGGAYRGPGGSAAEYMVKKNRFISAPSQWGSNTLVITSTAQSGDNTTITTASAHNITFTAEDTLNIYITGTTASNTELNNKYHEIVSASGSTIVIKTKTTASYSGGTLQLNYGNYTDTATSKNLTYLDHSLKAGYHYIFVTWTSKFNDRPLDDHILELYHKSSSFGDGVDASLTGATLLQTIYRSNATSDYHSMNQAFYLSIPEATTYYFRWVRKSRGEYHWGTDTLQMNDELINVDYITPSLNFWSLSQYTSSIDNQNYPIIHYGTGTTLNGRVGIGTTIPDADMEIAGTIHISEAQSADPAAPLDINDGGVLYVKDNGHLYFRNYNTIVDMVTVATAGEVNVISTRGNGASIYIDKFESNLRLRTFIGGNGIGITTTSSNEIQISRSDLLSNGNLGIGITNPDSKLDVNGTLGLREISSPAAPSASNGGVIWTSTDGKLYFKSNEISSARELSERILGTNVGSGVGVYKQRTNDNLEFKKFTSGNSQITVTDDTGNNDIKFTSNIQLNNAIGGLGSSMLKNIGTQNSYELKTIAGGTGVTIGSSDHTLIINSTGGGSGGTIAYGGAGGSGAEYLARKAYFSNSADITITSISHTEVNKTVINTSTAHGIAYTGSAPDEPTVIKIIGAGGTDQPLLNGKLHNVIEVIDNDTFVIDTNTTANATISGTISFNYGAYSSAGNPINLHTLDHSLETGKHYIFVNWNSNFNENPLDDQELELYYLSGAEYTDSINVAVTGTKLVSLYRSNKNTFNQTISKTIYLEVPSGNAYNLRWVRKSKNDYDWSNGISNMIDEKITVDYITPALSYWTLGQHNISGTNYPTVYFGEASTNTNLGRVGIGISTPLEPLHVKGNSYFDGNVSIGTNTTGNRFTVKSTGDFNATEGIASFKDVQNKEICIGGLGLFRRDSNANADLRLNFIGYNGGITQFRDLDIYDGKGGLISRFQGSTGNVGIGISNPTQKLQLYVNSNTDGIALAQGGQSVKTFITAGNNVPFIGVGNKTTGAEPNNIDEIGNGFKILYDNTGNVSFYNYNYGTVYEAMRLFRASGNVYMKYNVDIGGELQFVSSTSGQGLGKITYIHDATDTNRILKFTCESELKMEKEWIRYDSDNSNVCSFIGSGYSSSVPIIGTGSASGGTKPSAPNQITDGFQMFYDTDGHFYFNRYNGTTTPNQVLKVDRTNGTITIPPAVSVQGGLWVSGGGSTHRTNWTYDYISAGYLPATSDQTRTVAVRSTWYDGYGFLTYSDSRIKKEFENPDNSLLLQKIEDINLQKFEYIDKLTNGPGKMYGFKAQDIKNEIENSVTLNNGFIPNYFEMCQVVDKKIKVIDNHGFLVGDKIRIYDDNMKETKIINIENNLITVEEDIDTDTVFLYGKEINDLHTLNWDTINGIHIGATKELIRRLKESESKVETLENTMNTVLERLSNLENQS